MTTKEKELLAEMDRETLEAEIKMYQELYHWKRKSAVECLWYITFPENL